MATISTPPWSDVWEITGLRSQPEGEMVVIMEGRGSALGKVLIRADRKGDYNGVALSTKEARFLAEKLLTLADKLEKKAKAKGPCEECGRS